MNIKHAYKKFKSNIYYDNTLLQLRIKLAEYESDENFIKNLKKLEKEITASSLADLSFLNKYLKNIKFILKPKKIKPNSILEDNIYLNSKTLNKYDIEEFNAFIDCPIELHLISVLWITKIGIYLDEELSSNIHGNRLKRNSENIYEEKDFSLFEKYHEKYMKFRDGAIQKAISLHKEDLDTTVINLDIKSFFYNILFDFEKTCNPIIKINFKFDENNPKEFKKFNDYKKLNKIMNMIHSKYQNVLLKDKIYDKTSYQKIIPIGLLSSNIVSNYVLKNFDSMIESKIKPEFYSRYVDDILIVLSNISLEEKNTIEELFKNCIFKEINFSFKEESISFDIGINNFSFQNKKVKIFHFFKSDSIHLLEKFSKTITKNSSMFKLLPEDKDIFDTLEKSSYNIEYTSTVNKISSVNGHSLDILNISKNISQMTRIVLHSNYSQEHITHYNNQLDKIFLGVNILELQRLWEKVFTYLFISNSINDFIELSKRVINIIINIEYSKNIKIQTKLRFDTFHYFINSLSISISSCPSLFENNFFEKLDNVRTKSIESKLLHEYSLSKILKNSNNLRKSNLIRHYNIVSIPLLNYCNIEGDIALHKKNFLLKDFEFKINKIKIQYSPRFIHYHEISIFYHIKNLNNKLTDNEKSKYIENYEEFIYDEYQKLNNLKNMNTSYPKKYSNNKDKYYHYISNNPKHTLLKIALINIKIDINNSINSFIGKPNLSFERLFDIYKILNEAKLNSADIIVFPEISIPYHWLNQLSDFSKRNNIAIIFGMEHFTVRKTVYNYSVAILPFKINNHMNAFIHFNLKSHYAPSEIPQIRGRSYNIPYVEQKKDKLHIYKWANCVFSIFNCYELTDIKARGNLIGENDFTIAIEYNSDTNYFSNIVGSISRDNHAYIVQVNNSMYGDSRITQPTQTETMDIVKIKGGENTSLIIGKINIEKLRNFQEKTHELQMNEQLVDKKNSFKLTPPNFKVSKFRK